MTCIFVIFMMSFHLLLLTLETDVHRCEGGAVVCNNTLGRKKVQSQLILSIMHCTALGRCQDTLSGCQHQKITITGLRIIHEDHHIKKCVHSLFQTCWLKCKLPPHFCYTPIFSSPPTKQYRQSYIVLCLYDPNPRHMKKLN